MSHLLFFSSSALLISTENNEKHEEICSEGGGEERRERKSTPTDRLSALIWPADTSHVQRGVPGIPRGTICLATSSFLFLWFLFSFFLSFISAVLLLFFLLLFGFLLVLLLLLLLLLLLVSDRGEKFRLMSKFPISEKGPFCGFGFCNTNHSEISRR